MVKKKEIIPLIDVIIKINIRIFRDKVPIICCIATAAPVLVLEIM